jgi:hypothetical protein
MHSYSRRYQLVCTIVAVSCLTPLGAAYAEPHGVNFMIKSDLDQGFCMDARGGEAKEGTQVFVWRCHGRENQRWTLTDGVDGQGAVIGIGGLCLDVRGRRSGDGTPIQLWKCHYGDNQRFRFEHDRIVETHSGKCLTISHEIKEGAAVFIDDCGEHHRHQMWHLDR